MLTTNQPDHFFGRFINLFVNSQEILLPLPVPPAQHRLTIKPPAIGIIPLEPGTSLRGRLAPSGVYLFGLSLLEGQRLTVNAVAEGAIDLFVLDRFGLPVAYDLDYINCTGRFPQVSFQALGTGEYTIKFVSWTNEEMAFSMEILPWLPEEA